MARKAIFKHATQVNTSTYPDDGSSPVGSNEWNESPDAQGMLGFSPATATVTIASGVATITDSVMVVAAESGTTDTLDKIAITNTSQYDLVYLFADTGDTITLTHTSSLAADGQVSTVGSSNETLSSTTPTILIRKGNYWYGYGGGVVNAVSDIGDVTISSIASGELLKWNGSAWINQTLAEADIGTATAVATNTAKTGITSGQASAITANTAKVTYPTADSNKLAGIAASANNYVHPNHSGEVTSTADGATVVAGNIIDEANLKVSNAPTNGLFLQAQSGNTGGMTWASAGGGATSLHSFSNNTQTTVFTVSGQSIAYDVGTTVATQASGVGTRDVYIRKIDANNEGVFTIIHKNGLLVEVQIA